MSKKIFLSIIILLCPIAIFGQNNLIPDTLDCSAQRPPFSFEISQKWAVPSGISNLCTPLAGDIDGDGKTEILVMNNTGTTILIYDGNTGASVGSIAIGATTSYAAQGGTNNYVICDIEGDGKAELFLVNTIQSRAILYTVSSAPGVRPITFTQKWNVTFPNALTRYISYGVFPFVADLDGDGEPEFIAARHIIETDGTFCNINNNGTISKMMNCAAEIGDNNSLVWETPYAVDLDKDGRPEIVTGTDVYKYNGITKTATFWTRCPSFVNPQHGTNVAADINLDGNVDLVYSNTFQYSSPGSMVIWTPSTGQVIGTITGMYSGWRCYPVVGNIHGDEYPEICYNGQQHLVAYSFNGTSFSKLFDMSTNERSGLATFTFFDFNLDGICELVYRDEEYLRIMNCTGNYPVNLFTMPATSGTLIECPIVADVTGDGGADIIVTGSDKLYVFEGLNAKWASCPAIWNQQYYSPLLINRDLTVIPDVESPSWTKTDCKNNTARIYNGAPMQVPFISESGFCPIDVSSDVYIVGGNIEMLSASSIKITVTFGNSGLITAPASTPIRYYKNSISSANILSSANGVLGVDLGVGQTHTITKTITGLNPMPNQFYVRILDDGTNFPALGSFSDCNLTNNTKSFGTLELLKTVNSQSACVDGTSLFYLNMINNTNQTSNPTTFYNIVLTDSLGTGWNFISSIVIDGSVGAYNSSTRKLQWTVDSIIPGDTAKLIITAKTTSAGAIRNSAWVESVNGTALGKEVIEAYVIVNSSQAPSAATISPANPQLCKGNVTLTSSVIGASSYQWFRNYVEINGATGYTYAASLPGEYRVTYFDGTCVSQISDSVVVTTECLIAVDDYVTALKGLPVIFDVTDNDYFPSDCATSVVQILSSPSYTGTVILNGTEIKYTPLNGQKTDTISYRIYCSNNPSVLDTATIYVNIIEYPDNIIDADCYIDPPETTWDIERKKMTNVPVHWLATPFVGDIDKDGRLEVVVPGVASSSLPSSNILIFDDNLVLKRTIATPSAPQYETTNLLIGDVDGDGYGEIIIGSVDRTLMCYSHNGGVKWGPTVPYNASGPYGAPSLITADINRDGHAEILAIDNIYDGATGTLLVTLPAGGRGFSAAGPASYMAVFADIDNDGIQEVVAGNTVYKVNITNRNSTVGNSATIFTQMPMIDGFTSVADIDMDGDLDVIVTGPIGGVASMYVWDGATTVQIGNTVTNTSARISRAFAGDITGTGRPDIAYTYTNNIVAYSYDKVSNLFTNLWTKPTSDASGATTMSMFDFNQDGEVELVYRDQTDLRIINKFGNDIASFACLSGTHTEYPVVVDLDKNGHADILVSGGVNNSSDVYIMHYGSATPNQWAPARTVWNQHAYNSIHINEDLSIPQYPLNPAMAFPGPDGILGNMDDSHPYNNFLQQQTALSKDGTPIWLTPDLRIADSLVTTTVSGNSVSVNVCIVNRGDAVMLPPLYVTLYKNDIAPANVMVTVSENIQIMPGDTACLTATITDITIFNPVRIIVNINDNGNTHLYYPECDSTNNDLTILNPQLNRMMKKNATLNSVAENGTYPNPVSVLYGEEIIYNITAVNANLSQGTVIIQDTLPPYLDIVANSTYPPITSGTAPGTPTRTTLEWSIPNLASMASTSVSFKATPQQGASASQPLFINRAWVTVSDTIIIPTNSTFHQGAGISIMTFSTGYGGGIYNAWEQALDYMTTPSSGIIIVPDEGYHFTGWSHNGYVSLRGITIEAQAGIMLYDTLTVYGDVELRANFEPEKYPIEYHLNGGTNTATNPTTYTIESGMINLESPEKTGDVFVGWTGSNGEEPQQAVTIPKGSTGELQYYANFLNSGRENDIQKQDIDEDKIWAVKDELYIRTSKTGSIVRIYSTEGVLQKLHTIITAGESKMKLSKGIYAVTLNNNPGQIVRIE